MSDPLAVRMDLCGTSLRRNLHPSKPKRHGGTQRTASIRHGTSSVPDSRVFDCGGVVPSKAKVRGRYPYSTWYQPWVPQEGSSFFLWHRPAQLHLAPFIHPPRRAHAHQSKPETRPATRHRRTRNICILLVAPSSTTRAGSDFAATRAQARRGKNLTDATVV